MEEVKQETEEVTEYQATERGGTQEETVSFKKVSDRITYGALGYEGDELMALISGYDLTIAFNMKLINSLADAESCANALADVFYEILMEQLIAKNSAIVQPVTTEPSIL